MLVIGLVLLVLLTRRNVTVGLNAPIRYDDFVFTVLAARRTTPEQRIAPGHVPGTIDLVVSLEISNRARRVDFKFNDSMPVLVDEKGRTYQVSRTAQAALDAANGKGNPASRPIPPGTKVVRDLVFEVPPDVKSPHLRIMMGGRIGDVLETTLFGRKQFALP
jgi:hypothetical protein